MKSVWLSLILAGWLTVGVSPASELPLDCYQDGQNHTSLTDEQLIQLCRCAESAGPIDCFRRADVTTTLTDEQIIRLCAIQPEVYGLYGTLGCPSYRNTSLSEE